MSIRVSRNEKVSTKYEIFEKKLEIYNISFCTVFKVEKMKQVSVSKKRFKKFSKRHSRSSDAVCGGDERLSEGL